MAYRYDIFISYKRHAETLTWIRKHFVPLLDQFVGFELGWDPAVYVHEITQQVQAGTRWPEEIGRSLADSRILVGLWTKTYFNSRWCTEELAQMLAREEQTRCRSGTNTFGVIVPVVIHDGQDFPPELNYIQKLEIQRFYNTRMRTDSELAEQLSDVLRVHAPGFARAIENAPEWRPDWPLEGAKRFIDAFHRSNDPLQDRVPRFTTA